MKEKSKKVRYSGSANSLPRYGLRFKDGDELELPEEIAERLVGETIGFSFVEEKKAKR